jgi:hypothetical protein
MRKAKVEGNPTLIRDLNNNAILNIDKVGILNAKSARAHKRSSQQELNALKNEVTELKSMMREILERLRDG